MASLSHHKTKGYRVHWRFTVRTCHRSVENRPVIIESKPASGFSSCTPHRFLFQAFCFAGVAFLG